jgi:sugar phosphate permease
MLASFRRNADTPRHAGPASSAAEIEILLARPTLESQAEASRAEPPARPDRTQTDSTRYVWYVVILLTVVNVFNYMDRMALAVLMPAIKTDLALTDAQLGLLVGLAFSLFYAICGFPIARWHARRTCDRIIAESDVG